MINYQIDQQITDWIANNKERIIEKWIKLCEIPSIKSEGKPGAPFGENCAEALKYAASLFESENIKSELFADSGYALATYGDADKTIGLFSHSDVVPVGEDWIFTEPFKPVIKDGALICRGAEDNKSGIIASLCATEFFRDNDIKLKSKLQSFIGSDEECGMEDMINYLNQQKMPDVSIVPDADFPCSTGEKGIYHFWCESKENLSDIISISGGEAFNIVLDKVTTAIKFSDALYNELENKLVSRCEFKLSKDADTISLLAKGVAKHASIPDGSVNAAYLTADLLGGCENISVADKLLLLKIKEILSSSYGESLNVYHEDENFGKTTTVNGMIKTENNKICLSFDCRYGDSYNPETLENNSEAVLNKYGFDITYKDNRAGFSIDKNSEIPLALEEVYAEITGEKLKSVLMSGGTYARRLKNAFSIGTFIINKNRTSPVLKMPEGHGGPHQCDEMIDLEGFFEALRVLIHYILTCDDIINR
jgi:succinyl-diaminopimelate desuccinylase